MEIPIESFFFTRNLFFKFFVFFRKPFWISILTSMTHFIRLSHIHYTEDVEIYEEDSRLTKSILISRDI